MRWVALLALAAVASCLRTTSFECNEDSDCASRVQGMCESVGFCSFPDQSCASGRRFGSRSGPYADQCVGGAGPDGGTPDARIDASVDAGPCPSSYAPINGSAHVYRAISSTATYAAQRDACIAEGGYLAVPDDQDELDAILSLGGSTWVGINDLATEGEYVTSLGAPATFLPWANGEPNDAPPGEDCVRVSSSTRRLSDERCSLSYRAVCECAP
ncbi:MAG: lectin-like protein [Kofleriaceae bacterium]